MKKTMKMRLNGVLALEQHNSTECWTASYLDEDSWKQKDEGATIGLGESENEALGEMLAKLLPKDDEKENSK